VRPDRILLPSICTVPPEKSNKKLDFVVAPVRVTTAARVDNGRERNSVRIVGVEPRSLDVGGRLSDTRIRQSTFFS
jgi:hypothetical protein